MHNMQFLIVLTWVSFMILIPNAFAQAPTLQTENRYMSRLVPFEPSHAIFQKSQNDQAALNARYSFRYSLLSDQLHEMPCSAATPDNPDGKDCYEWFLSYTGEFDFYARTRTSDPVINRVSNPATHIRWRDKEGSYVDLGVQHRSNGQVKDPNADDVKLDAARAYATGNYSYFDDMSRGANYLSIEGSKLWPDHYQFTASGKLYITQNGEVNWGPLANSNPKFSDYDRLQFRARASFKRADLGLEWTLGDRGLSTDSWNADLSIVLCGLPFYLRYHHGPMRTLSNYTQPQNAIGFGIKFMPNPWARANRSTDSKALKQDTKNVQ